MREQASENGYELRTRANVVRLFWWCGAWAATCMLVALGPRFLWNKVLAVTLLAVALNLCIGIGTILANKKYFDQLDELQRRVHLNSLAITVAVAMIAGIPYSVMAAYRVIPFHADISHLMVLMSLTYAACNLYGTRRYR